MAGPCRIARLRGHSLAYYKLSTSATDCSNRGNVEQNCRGRPGFAFASSTTLFPQRGVPHFHTPQALHENAAAKALGMPSNTHKLKSRILISIQTKNITSAKAPANGWKRGTPLSGFSRENWQKCQVQQSL